MTFFIFRYVCSKSYCLLKFDTKRRSVEISSHQKLGLPVLLYSLQSDNIHVNYMYKNKVLALLLINHAFFRS